MWKSELKLTVCGWVQGFRGQFESFGGPKHRLCRRAQQQTRKRHMRQLLSKSGGNLELVIFYSVVFDDSVGSDCVVRTKWSGGWTPAEQLIYGASRLPNMWVVLTVWSGCISKMWTTAASTSAPLAKIKKEIPRSVQRTFCDFMLELACKNIVV
jgi:hypothetical protein